VTVKDFEELKKRAMYDSCRVKGYYDDPFMVTFEEGCKFMKDVIIDILLEHEEFDLKAFKVITNKLSKISDLINEPIVTGIQRYTLPKHRNTLELPSDIDSFKVVDITIGITE
jgi:hypothetical protein